MTTLNEDDAVEMEVFRCGDYGPKGSYTEADLDAIAADYSAERHEAPLTLDHAQSGPALGWVGGLRRSGDRLVAAIRGIPEAVREVLRSGAFKKRSVELIRSLPDTGRPYLRAVSLLGAASPEVKGLRDVSFAAAPGGEVLRFAEDELRDSELEGLRREVAELRTRAFGSELDAIFADANLAGRDAGVLRALVTAQARDGIVRFADQQVDLLDWLRAFLKRATPVVPLGEIGTAASPSPQPAEEFSERTDPRSLQMHQRAATLQAAEPGLPYVTALLRAAAGQ